MAISNFYQNRERIHTYVSAQHEPVRGFCSMLSFPEQIAILNRYIKEAAIAAEVGEAEQRKWLNLIEKQAISIEVLSQIYRTPSLFENPARYLNPRDPLFAASVTRNEPQGIGFAAAPIFRNSPRGAFSSELRQNSSIAENQSKVEDSFVDNPPYISTANGTCAYVKTGGLETYPTWKFRMATGGLFGPFVAKAQIQVWDSSINPPLLLLGAASPGRQSALFNEMTLWQRYVLYPIYSYFEPHYSSSYIAKAQACYNNMRSVDEFFTRVFFENPIDVDSTRFRGYINEPLIFDNACWIPRNGTSSMESESIHFGESNPNEFGCWASNFTITAHEAGHAVVSAAGGLATTGQPGALNESIADAFAIMAQHYQTKTLANSPDANWLIGEGIRVGAARGSALRSMKEPGTAFQNHLGEDDLKIAHMRDFLTLSPNERPDPVENDNGYIHANCGIPNKAFYLASVGIGGYTYEKVGRIWHRAVFSIRPTDGFATFAHRTLKATKELGYNSGLYNILGKAWTDVGIDLRNESSCNLL